MLYEAGRLRLVWNRSRVSHIVATLSGADGDGGGVLRPTAADWLGLERGVERGAPFCKDDMAMRSANR